MLLIISVTFREMFLSFGQLTKIANKWLQHWSKRLLQLRNFSFILRLRRACK